MSVAESDKKKRLPTPIAPDPAAAGGARSEKLRLDIMKAAWEAKTPGW